MLPVSTLMLLIWRQKSIWITGSGSRWLRGTVVKCQSFSGEFFCPALNLLLIGDYLCG